MTRTTEGPEIDQELFTIQDPYVQKHMLDIADNPSYDPEYHSDMEVDPPSEEEEMEYDDETKRILQLERSLEDNPLPKKKPKLREEEDERPVVAIGKVQVSEEAKAEQAARWFQKDIFAGVEEISTKTEKQLKKESKREKLKQKDQRKLTNEAASSGFEIVPQEYPEEQDDKSLVETIALGKAMLRKKRRRDIEDSTYNRYSFDDPSNLPDWFLADQEKHYQAPLPVSQDELLEARMEVSKHTKRSTKKVEEAIARRKRRLGHKLEKLRTKAESVVNQEELSESVKMKQIEKMYKKELLNNKPKKKYIVTKGFWDAKKRSRKGGRGVKYVDKRLKKDTKAKKLRSKKR